MTKLKTTFFILLVFLFSAIIVVLNFKGYQMAGGDGANYINPLSDWNQNSTSWSWNGGLSRSTVSGSPQFLMPFALFFKVFSFLPPVVEQYFYFALIFTSIFLVSFLFFYKYLFRNVLSAFASSLFYFLNLFFFISDLNLNIHSSFILLPLLFILCHEIINQRIKQIIVVSIAISIIMPTAFQNPAAPVVLLPVSIIYFLYILFRNKYEINHIVKVFGTASSSILFIMFLNIWWIIPFLYSFTSENFDKMWSNAAENVVFMFRTTSMYDAFRFIGSWAFKLTDATEKKIMAQNLYSENVLFIFISYIPIIASFCSLFYIKKNKKILFFIFLAIFGLTLAKGDLNPFGQVYYYLYNHISALVMFREPYTKFMLVYVFSISILLGYFIHYFLHGQKNRNRILICYGIITIIILQAIPFFFGRFTNHINASGKKSILTKIPQYLYNYNKYSHSRKLEYRNVVTPDISKMFLWESGVPIDGSTLWYFGKPIYLDLSNRLVLPRDPIDRQLIRPLFSRINTNDDKIMNLLGLLNVGAFLQQNDVDWRFNASTANPTLMENYYERLEKKQYIEKGNSFGLFDRDYLLKIPNEVLPQTLPGITDNNNLKEIIKNELYQQLINKPAIQEYDLNKKYFLPIFYTPKKVSVVFPMSDPTNFIFNNNTVRKALYVNNQPNIKEVLFTLTDKNLLNSNVILEFKKISNTKYRIIVHKATTTFPIVFSDSFNKEWHTYVVKNNKSTNNIDRHFSSENYYISPENKKDQAAFEDVETYIKNGWVSNLETDGSIKFISKNFRDTIQNDNLLNGVFYETWFLSKNIKQIADNNHLQANYYANSWIIDPSEICSAKDFCKKNSDGSYDIELIIEFGFQKIFISLITFSLAMLIVSIIFIIMRTKKYANK